MNNRLQFVHNNALFKSRDQALNFLTNDYFKFNTRPSLYAEPIVLRYGDKDNPNVILAIGATGDGANPPVSDDSSYFIIDIKGIQDDIESKNNALNKKISGVTYDFKSSDTFNLQKVGNVVSGNVKIPEKVIIGDAVKSNIIKFNKDGIYSFVNVNFDDKTNEFKFQINDDVKTFKVPTVIKGYYDINKEAIVLNYSDGSTKEINLAYLINEWETEGDQSTTPIVLTKEIHDKANTDLLDRRSIGQWHDILKGDIRIDENNPDNILEKTKDGHALLVRGTADNIKYNSEKTVKDALDAVSKVPISTKAKDNIIFRHYNNLGDFDGICASVDLQYNSATDVLTFYYSNSDGNSSKKEFKLNSTSFINDFSYDSTTKTLIIRYTDKNGVVQKSTVPLTDILDDWVVSNEGHTVKLAKTSVSGGKDILTGDVKLSELNNQILEEIDHKLYVRGTADNIKYDSSNNVTVKDKLDSHNKNIDSINGIIGEGDNNNIVKIRKSVGLNDDYEYSAVTEDENLSGATSLKDADSKLSKAINFIKDKVNRFKNIFISEVEGSTGSTANVNVNEIKDDNGNRISTVSVDINIPKTVNDCNNLISGDTKGIYFTGSIDYGTV